MRKRTREIGLPIGYEVREEAKTVRRAFALKASVLDAFKEIAERKGTNPNALLNELMENYVRQEVQ